MKGKDGLLLVGGEPMVSWNPSVVFVDLAVALFPVIELAGLDSEPSHDLLGRNAAAILPMTNIVDHRIAGVVGNPHSVQSSPSSFFS